MKKMIAFCGLDCQKCDAYIATKTNDQALREKTAKLWSELNNTTILPEHINCDGCRVDGRKTVFCDRLCGIRQCALKKGVDTCGSCMEMQTCKTLAAVTNHNPDALKNLRSTLRFKFNTVGLFTNDNKATVEFYTKTFGFTTSWDGIQPNVEMFLGDNRIILFPRDAFEQMVSKKFQYPEGFNGTMELSLDVPTFADVDKEYQNALNYGAKSVFPPTTEPWGQRTCYVADPDGNLIEIGSFVEK